MLVTTLALHAILGHRDPRYIETMKYKVIGWRTNCRYFVVDAESTGTGGPGNELRFAADAEKNSVKIWKCEGETSDPKVDVQSKSWMDANPAVKGGKNVFVFRLPVFQGKRIPAAKSLTSFVNFRTGGKTYAIRLVTKEGPGLVGPDGPSTEFKDHEVTAQIQRDGGPWRTFYEERGYKSSVIAALISQVQLSPNGKNVGVLIGRYRCMFYEGWNAGVERIATATRLP
ncbi:MAG: hypothetical protein JST35_07770 [Armatimonadetes bacterium]|nr:hypothetical protein [Armatimonadota bacterium]